MILERICAFIIGFGGAYLFLEWFSYIRKQRLRKHVNTKLEEIIAILKDR